MQRACAAALVKAGHTLIKSPGHSNDDKAAVKIVSDLGAVNVEYLRDGDLEIISDGVKNKKTTIDCGESGLSIRMFTPLAALNSKETTITGSGSLTTRPLDLFDTILPELGVNIKSNDGRLPIKIRGPLQQRNIEVDGSLSSQFLTGLLLAFAAADAKDVTIKVQNLKSRPYIDLTLAVMKEFGMKMPENSDYKEFYFRGEPHFYPFTYQEYTVERDWSGAAFLLVAGAIAGPVTIRGLDLTSTQADKAIVDALMSANAAIAIEAKGIQVHPVEMNGFDFDASDCPDLFPPLVALAAYCRGITQIKGVNRLIHKESNRALALQEEFGKMGVRIELKENVMLVHGGGPMQGGKVHSRQDHRIAMACAIAALKASGETMIEEAQAVNKSYPDFFLDLKSLGAAVSLPADRLKH
jgi:3-phosphoshikimate 1-carboxyvinyltransferase